MKIQFLFVVVLCAVVEGQNYAYQGRSDNVPLIKDGVPIDTPEVQAAKAAHFEAYERARALAAKSPSNGEYEEYVSQRYRSQPRYQQQQFQQQPYQQNYQQGAYYQQQTYQQQPAYQQQHYQNNVIYTQPKQQNYAIGAYSSDIPVDTPEVQQARTAHLAALSQLQNHHYRIRRGIYLESHHQVPEETPEVQAARYQHLVAHATAHDEDDDDYYEAPHTDTEYYHVPILTKKGVPVNTAAVKAARQQHLLAHKLEKAGIRHDEGLSHHIPVISANGVPFDTPEVHAAKIEHLAAHAKEHYSGYGGGYHF